MLVETKTFIEPRFKTDRNKDVTLSLQALDEFKRLEVSTLYEGIVLAYFGDEENGIEASTEIAPNANGFCIKLNREICLQVASLLVMQTTKKQEEKYDFEELVMLAAVMPNVWRQILRWRDKLNTKGAKQTGEVLAGSDTSGVSEPA